MVQHTGAESIAPGATSKTTNLRLNFNHPVKTLIWALKGEKHGQFTTGPRGTDNDRYAPLQSAKLQLNGTSFIYSGYIHPVSVHYQCTDDSLSQLNSFFLCRT